MSCFRKGPPSISEIPSVDPANPPSISEKAREPGAAAAKSQNYGIS
ncbi:hypothetical protein BIFADO_02469 [Bifidobacterium adolescentis L2-32]|uniref:Uncharacterized protein n=1 Tax=Bifidobacterium adolescentis L2-32 TaxID=411481 RepID=A7A9C0_BIFAD|nr:hypothetical protein BIFADO_02469 [Bifidobacterium adolescentis L2-32]